jgi:glucose-6-phosphate 1-dehydrogenase
VIADLMKGSAYIQSDFQDSEGYEKLLHFLQEKGYHKVIFYLATPPDDYIEIIQNLSVCRNYADDNQWLRIVVEKPYGRDLETARNLENFLHLCSARTRFIVSTII